MILACVAVASVLCMSAAHGQSVFQNVSNGQRLTLASALPEVKLTYLCTSTIRCPTDWTIIESSRTLHIEHLIKNLTCADTKVRGNTSHSYNVTCQKRCEEMYCTYAVLHIRNLTVSQHNGTKVTVENHASPASEVWLNVKDCDWMFTGAMFNIDRVGNAKFGDKAHLSCARAGAQTFRAGVHEDHFAVCNATAQWEIQDVDCWYEPRMKLHIENETGTTVNVTDGANIAIHCDHVYGHPSPTSSLHYGQAAPASVKTNEYRRLVKKSDNNVSVFCDYSNGFTRYYNYTNETNQVRLNVLFAPVNVRSNESCFTELTNGSYSFHVSIKFFVNAWNTEVCLNNDTVVNGSFCEVPQDGSNWAHAVREKIFETIFQVSNLTIKNFSYVIKYYMGETQETTPMRHFVLRDCPITPVQPTNTIPTSSGSTDTTENSADIGGTSLPLIAACAGVGGLLLLIGIIVISCMIVKKRKGVEKEEVANPIYATTSMITKNAEQVSEKEERENPLYSTTNDATYAPVNKKKKNAKQTTTSSQQADTNETYATVSKIKEGKKKKKESDEQAKADETYVPLDKIKKGKKKKGADKNGQSNDGFSGPPEALYAAVNKKKDATGGSDQPSMSGLGKNGDAAEECTYAAVQKKGNRKPKRDGSDDEDLHGSTKP